jgi:hypothetical protein
MVTAFVVLQDWIRVTQKYSEWIDLTIYLRSFLLLELCAYLTAVD